MSFPSAVLTNSITNGLHAVFLLAYFLLSIYQYSRKNPNIQSLLVVFFFFFVFAVKILGVAVHYGADSLSPFLLNRLWIAISLGSICLDYCLLYGLAMPDIPRRATLGSIVVLNLIFINQASQGIIQYHYIALSLMTVFIVGAYYSSRLTRVAFICAIISNFLWIVLRETISLFYINLHDNIQYRYDNDLYHFMLIVSTYLIYLSIIRGCWTYPEKQKVI